MDLKGYLTNEKIRKKFVSQFDLVNYAIKLAENMIITGRDPRVKTDSQNRSLQVLSEILSGKDYLDDLTIEVDEDELYTKELKAAHAVDNDDDDDEDEAPKKTAEKKKSRKATAKNAK